MALLADSLRGFEGFVRLSGLRCQSLQERKKNYASSKNLLTSIKEKGPLGKKSPFTKKEKGGVSEDQEGCGQTSLSLTFSQVV